MWSPGPYATSEIFEELKVQIIFLFFFALYQLHIIFCKQNGRDQPDPVKAASFSSDLYSDNVDKYNPAIYVSHLIHFSKREHFNGFIFI